MFVFLFIRTWLIILSVKSDPNFFEVPRLGQIYEKRSQNGVEMVEKSMFLCCCYFKIFYPTLPIMYWITDLSGSPI